MSINLYSFAKVDVDKKSFGCGQMIFADQAQSWDVRKRLIAGRTSLFCSNTPWHLLITSLIIMQYMDDAVNVYQE